LDQQRQINDAHCLDSFDAADELAVGCAPHDGGESTRQPISLKEIPSRSRRSRFASTRFRSANSTVEQVESTENDIGAVSAAAEQLNGCAIS
jgi:hypothetical protein